MSKVLSLEVGEIIGRRLEGTITIPDEEASVEYVLQLGIEITASKRSFGEANIWDGKLERAVALWSEGEERAEVIKKLDEMVVEGIRRGAAYGEQKKEGL